VTDRTDSDKAEPLRNWAGNLTYSAADVRRPRSVEELQELVASSRHVRAMGSRHSFSTVGDTAGVLVSTRDIGLVTEVDAGTATAVVPGAATYAEVSVRLEQDGWALPNLGSLPHISVAGACATGTHGSGVRNGCLATAVEAVEMVRGDGELVTVHSGEPDFPGVVVSLGSLGVVTSLTLRLEPTFDIAQDVLLDVPSDVVTEAGRELLGSAYSVSLFTTFQTPATVDSVWRKHRTDRGPASTETWGGRPADHPVHPIVGLDASSATEQLGRPGRWHERLPHFRAAFTPSVGDELQSEFLLPIESLREVWPPLCEGSGRFRDALQVMEVRTVAGDDLWLSPFQGRDTLAVHATWVSDWERVRPALTALEELVAPYDPRPHWGKVFAAWDAERIAAGYPQLPRFRDLADRLDPTGCFINDYARRLGVRASAGSHW
jgi:xylitol oxidase